MSHKSRSRHPYCPHSKRGLKVAGTNELVIPGLPSRHNSGHDRTELLRILIATNPSVEEMAKSFAEIELLYNTCYLLTEEYATYKGGRMSLLIDELLPMMKELDAKDPKIQTQDWRNRLTTLVVDLSEIIGRLPAIRVAKCEREAGIWMKKTKEKRHGNNCSGL